MNLKDHNKFDSDFVDGKHASNSANNVPVLDSNAKLPFDQIPTGTVAKTVSEGNHIHDDKYYTEEEIDDMITTSEENINTNIDSAISDSKNEILNNVSNNYVTAKDYNDFKSNVSSQISQTETNMNTNISNISKNVDSLNEQLKDFKGALGNNIQTGNDSVSIGNSNSSTNININNGGISFTDNNQEVAYISNQQMTIVDAVIKNSLTLDNFRFIPRVTGNVSLIWDNGNNIVVGNESYCNVTNNNYPTTTMDLISKGIAGEIYTVEICGTLGAGLSSWGVYNSGGSVWMCTIENWRFNDGVAFKSFKWNDNNGQVDSTYLQIYTFPNIEARPNSTLTYLKMYKGDDYWKNHDYWKNSDNILIYNNIFDYPKGTQNGGLWIGGNEDDHYVETDIYGYFEAGVAYQFSCDIDGRDSTDFTWGGDTTNDTVQAYMTYKDAGEWVHVEINTVSTFTVPTSGRWWLRLDVNKANCSHWFSNLWVTEV